MPEAAFIVTFPILAGFGLRVCRIFQGMISVWDSDIIDIESKFIALY
jgi:hypothetical protein